MRSRAAPTAASVEAFASVAHLARHCVVLTGAGVSAESGVPTFRGKDGFWGDQRAEDLATPEAFERDPERVLAWYEWRRQQLADIRPNPAHIACAGAPALFETFTLVTQNVDGLHEAAGSTEVVELHGSLQRDRCHACGRRGPAGAARACTCGGRMRPDVVWFGELLPAEAIQRAMEAAGSCDLLVSAGTSALVYPAAHLPYLARESGATVVEVNIEETALTPYADLVYRGTAGEWLPRLLDPVVIGDGRRSRQGDPV